VLFKTTYQAPTVGPGLATKRSTDIRLRKCALHCVVMRALLLPKSGGIRLGVNREPSSHSVECKT
jgi:hypothetical protein